MATLVEQSVVPAVEEEPTVEDVERNDSGEVREEAIRRDQLPQKDYYGKWDKFADEETTAIDEEDERAKAASDEALGRNKYANSAAEEKDTATNAALKEAKKAWDKRRALEEGQKFEVKDETGVERVLSQEELQKKRVILFKNCHQSTYTLPASLVGLIKIFVEHCSDCSFTVGSSLITSMVELSHCDRVVCRLDTVVHTIQADLCDGLTLEYGEGLLVEGQEKIYHAGVKALQVSGHGGKLSTDADYIRDGAGDELPEEQHFITQVVAGELLVEKAVRVGDRWSTARELALESAAAKAVTAREREELAHQAERSKLSGNQAFQNAEYAQAAVHYTMAIDQAGSASKGLATDGNDEGAADGGDKPAALLTLVTACYSNRAACFLKLGQHERAIEDAESCIRSNPKFVKGHFRKGLALHAMGRPYEALPCLGKALELENPKNKTSVKQIQDAIRFAEAKFAAQRAGKA